MANPYVLVYAHFRLKSKRVVMEKGKNAFGLVSKTSNMPVSEPPKKQLIELRKLLLDERADEVVRKVVNIALDDEHPVQAAALKMCMDRLLPMSEFEKAGGGSRPTITINIGGVNDEPEVVEGEIVGRDN